MADFIRLLPDNATPFELAEARVNDPWAMLADVFNGIPATYTNPPPDLLPFLVWQYGLGELSPFVPNLYDLIEEGIQWQRVRGTPLSITYALGFVGYAGTLEEEPSRRLRWNRFQIALSRIRDHDTPDLVQIDGVVSLSPPARSNFGRGYRGWDVRAFETGYQKTGAALYGDHSGVRIANSQAQWSFGRDYDLTVTLSSIDLGKLGAWSAPASASPLWITLTTPWVSNTGRWFPQDAQTRRDGIVAAIAAQTAYVVFRDVGGDLIGYARATVRPVTATNSGAGDYVVNGVNYIVSATPTNLLASCRTPFGAGNGSTAASVSLAANPVLASGVRPGALWLDSSDILSANEIAASPISIAFGATVREHVSFVFGLDGPYSGGELWIDYSGSRLLADSSGALLLNG